MRQSHRNYNFSINLVWIEYFNMWNRYSTICRMQKKKTQPPLTFVTVEDDPLLGTKKIETAEIFVWKQKICSESQCVLLVSFINLPPHILVDSWSSSFLSTSKDCPPPHFLTHSHTSVYELFNFKIVSQKVVHVCIILYSQIYF